MVTKFSSVHGVEKPREGPRRELHDAAGRQPHARRPRTSASRPTCGRGHAGQGQGPEGSSARRRSVASRCRTSRRWQASGRTSALRWSGRRRAPARSPRGSSFLGASRSSSRRRSAELKNKGGGERAAGRPIVGRPLLPPTDPPPPITGDQRPHRHAEPVEPAVPLPRRSSRVRSASSRAPSASSSSSSCSAPVQRARDLGDRSPARGRQVDRGASRSLRRCSLIDVVYLPSRQAARAAQVRRSGDDLPGRVRPAHPDHLRTSTSRSPTGRRGTTCRRTRRSRPIQETSLVALRPTGKTYTAAPATRGRRARAPPRGRHLGHRPTPGSEDGLVQLRPPRHVTVKAGTITAAEGYEPRCRAATSPGSTPPLSALVIPTQEGSFVRAEGLSPRGRAAARPFV